MKKLPKITDAEWEVMRVLWQEPPLTALEVHERLASSTTWTARTVKTLINRLYEKGALTRKKNGRAFAFAPKVPESACVRAENRSFLQRVYGGALSPMLTHLLENEELSREELVSLRELLDQKEQQQ